jgi:opacity protein-like surface antigen
MKKSSNMQYEQMRIPCLATCAIFSLGLAVSSAQNSVATSYVAPRPVADSGTDLGYYLNGDLGLSIIPDFQSSRFGFPGNFHMDEGIRFGLEPGYNFLTLGDFTFGGEFETGVAYNRIASVWAAGLPTSSRGDFYQVPLLGNLVVSFHPCTFVEPYVGVGGGGDCTWARIHSWDFFGTHMNNDEVDPAMQAMGGVRFRLNSLCDVGVGYKFLADFPSSGKYVPTHDILASFTVKF